MCTALRKEGLSIFSLWLDQREAWEDRCTMRLGRKAGARACPCPGPGVGGGEKQAPRCFQKLTATRLWMSGYDELSELAKGDSGLEQDGESRGKQTW